MSEPQKGNFWSPLSLRKVLLVFLTTNIVMFVIVVALREGLGLTWIPIASAGGAGAVAAIAIISSMAKKARGDSNRD